MNIDRDVIFKIINRVFILIVIITSFITIVAVLTKDVGTKTLNEIGGAIGGITSPIVGILGALLVYLTFEQQNKAIQKEKQVEDERLKVAKELIVLDLKDNIKGNLLKFINDTTESTAKLSKATGTVIIETINYTELNVDIYNSIGMKDIYLSFGVDTLTISSIYRRMEFVKSRSFGVLYEEYIKNKKSVNTNSNIKDMQNKLNETFGLNILSVKNVATEIIDDIDKIVNKYK